jgi:hypothetical protein
MDDTSYIVVCQAVVGGCGRLEIVYSWDGQKFENIGAADNHGFRTRGSDDFNIAKIKNEKLVWFGYFDGREEHQLDHSLQTIAHYIGIRA